jgi:hypothetical protein
MKFDKGYALIVGIANYPHIKKLPAIVLKDARDIYAMLGGDPCGFHQEHLKLLLDEGASIENIRQGMDWLSTETGPEDTAILYFSSHGGRVESGNFLLPYDCCPNRLNETAISGNELTRLIRKIRAGRLLILFDFCFSGGTGDPKALESEIPGYKSGYAEAHYDSLAEGRGRVIIASSRTDEVSMILPGMNNSLFTYYLLEALQGSAYSRGDGLIRVFDIFDYVSDQVRSHYDQHPIFKASDLEDNFPVSLFQAGKSAVSRYIPDSKVLTGVSKSGLREFILQYFSMEDLKVLCADIQEALTKDQIRLLVSMDMVGGESLPARVLNLIQYLDRRGRLNYLVESVRKSRAGISTTFFES